MSHKKARHKSHRLWNEDNVELQNLEKQLQTYQKQINSYKKKEEAMKVKRDFYDNNDLKNELADLIRQRQPLQDDIKVLTKIKNRKDKEVEKFKTDIAYDDKVGDFLDTLRRYKNEYKRMQKEHTAKQKEQKVVHDNLMELQNENVKLKRQMIDIKAKNKLKIEKSAVELDYDKLTKKKEAIDNTIENDNKRTKFYLKRCDIDQNLIQEQTMKVKQEIEQRKKENIDLGKLNPSNLT